MSLLLNGTSQYLSLATALATAAPLSFAAWVKPTSVTGLRLVAGIGRSGQSTVSNRFYLALNGGVATMYSAATAGSSATAGTAGTGSWQHVSGRTASVNSRFAALGGTLGSEQTTSRTPGSLNTSSIGASVATPVDSFFEGRLAHAAIWSVALSDAEIASLAAGALPSSIQAASLLAYLPLTSDFTDTKGNTWTNNGTATIDGADNPTMASAGKPWVYAHLLNNVGGM